MKIKLICFLVFLCSGALISQSGFTTIGGANFLGYGRAGVNISGIESIYMNQAGLSDIKNYALDISAERRFNLEELTNISIVGAKTLNFGTVGILLSNFGFAEYNEQKFALAYSRRLSPGVSLGGQFDLLRYNIEKIGSKNLISFEMGMQIKLNKEFSLATHIFSPGKIEVNETTDIGTRFRIGIMYKPSGKVFLLAEVDKLIYREAEYKLGLSYQLINEMQINLGINPVAEFYSFGIRLSFRENYKMSTAVALQDRLGNSPAISFQYNN
ncbi:MAG: hypothetical protein WBP08_07885 [Saprospiraceae bacterium]|nr:hypothetical protein [Saprospiraceae bacterium]